MPSTLVLRALGAKNRAADVAPFVAGGGRLQVAGSGRLSTQSAASGFFSRLCCVVPEAIAHEASEESARVFRGNSAGMFCSGNELQPAGFAPADKAASHGVLKEHEQPLRVLKIRRHNVPKSRRC